MNLRKNPEAPNKPKEFIEVKELLFNIENIDIESNDFSLEKCYLDSNKYETENFINTNFKNIYLSLENIYIHEYKFDISFYKKYQKANPNYQQELLQYNLDLEKYQKDLIDWNNYCDELIKKKNHEDSLRNLENIKQDFNLRGHLSRFIEDYNARRSRNRKENKDMADKLHQENLELYNKMLELL